jgi:PKD repeat protein/uncharacterized protein YegL
MRGKAISIVISVLMIVNVLAAAIQIEGQPDSEISENTPIIEPQIPLLPLPDESNPTTDKTNEKPIEQINDPILQEIEPSQPPQVPSDPIESSPVQGSPSPPEPAEEEDPPVAKAGDDQTVLEGETVYFDGSASYKTEGEIESYEWDFDANADADGDGNYTNDFEGYSEYTSHIYGDNGVYEVILRVESKTEGGEGQVFQDVVFCADNSGSMSQSSVDLLKDGLKVYVAEMSMPDHGAVIPFGGSAVLMNPLTQDYDQLKGDIVSIPGPHGGTYMVTALQKAIDEIELNGNADHTKVIILHTDGQPTDGNANDVRNKATLAASKDIIIYTIGLEPAPGYRKLDEDLLKDVANITGGKYYYAPSALFLATIYKEIAQLVEYPGGLPLQDTDSVEITVKNLEPDISSMTASSEELGVPILFSAQVTDEGSDDLYFTWDWDDGTTDSAIFYNNGASPDPYPSPEVNPRDIIQNITHTYTTAGTYEVTLTIYDDDNGTAQNSLLLNVGTKVLIADFTWSPNPQDEGYPVQFTDTSTFDPGDTITYDWDFSGLGFSNVQNPVFTFMDDGVYSVSLAITDEFGNAALAIRNLTINDLAPTADFTWSPDPQVENSQVTFVDMSTSYPDEMVAWMWDFGDGVTSYDRNTTHIYGDDGIYPVTLTVFDDDNSSGSITYDITVINIDPTVTIDSILMDVEIGLRVAGRKWNKVTMTLSEEEVIFGYAEIIRTPGSPDEQMAWIPKVLDMTKAYTALLTYIPVDPPKIGANPVWVYVRFPNGSIQKIHHTFNVQQSTERDSDHWNHIDPWEVDLNAHLIGWAFEVHYHVTDPGSDDEILTFTYGSQNVVVTHLNNPSNPDPYPSPEINPVDIFDFAELIYEGAGTLTLTAQDDDNIRMGAGEDSDSIDVG